MRDVIVDANSNRGKKVIQRFLNVLCDNCVYSAMYKLDVLALSLIKVTMGSCQTPNCLSIYLFF